MKQQRNAARTQTGDLLAVRWHCYPLSHCATRWRKWIDRNVYVPEWVLAWSTVYALLKTHRQSVRCPTFLKKKNSFRFLYFFIFKMTFLLIRQLSIAVNEAANWDTALNLEVMFLCHPMSQVGIAQSICGASWQITLLIFSSWGLLNSWQREMLF